MKQFEGKVVAITGAGSGIGRALAENWARLGAVLALSDRTAEPLEGTAARVREMGGQAMTWTVDVRQRTAVEQWQRQVLEECGATHVLVNNAGVSLNAAVADMSLEDFQWLMDTNFWGVVHATQAFLPTLIAAEEAHIVNVSSIFGLMAVPTQSAYNAAKFAVTGFSNALRMEMLLQGHSVGVTCVHPGGIRTNIVRSGRFSQRGALSRPPQQIIDSFDRSLARNTPEYCAERIVRAVRRNAPRLLVGGDAKLYDWLVRWFPQAHQGLLVRDLRRRWRL